MLQQLRDDSARGRGGRGYSQRGYGNRYIGYRGARGRGWQQRNDGDRRFDASYNNSESNYESNAGTFYTEIEVKMERKSMNVEVNNCNKVRIDWVLDNGCTGSYNK